MSIFWLPSAHIIPVILLGERRKKVTLERVILLFDAIFHIVLFNWQTLPAIGPNRLSKNLHHNDFNMTVCIFNLAFVKLKKILLEQKVLFAFQMRGFPLRLNLYFQLGFYISSSTKLF